MNYRTLGRSVLRVSPICHGGMTGMVIGAGVLVMKGPGDFLGHGL